MQNYQKYTTAEAVNQRNIAVTPQDSVSETVLSFPKVKLVVDSFFEHVMC